MMDKPLNAVFLGSGRCFHTMDWFRSCGRLTATPPVFITDNYGREGFAPLLRETDSVRELLIIDSLLPKRASSLGHKWRNLLKLALIPIQIVKLRRTLRDLRQPFVFAHSTYYAFLASFCDVPYCATPQGSEVLVRPQASRFYRYLLTRSVRHASFVTVDSVAMAGALQRLTRVTPRIVQNGIDVSKIGESPTSSARTLVTSIRGLASNYRIVEIIEGRNQAAPAAGLNFSFPFSERDYFQKIEAMLGQSDVLHRGLSRELLYEVFRQSVCVISIPKSDSSPRSVYEAIFCGAAVICTYAPYIDALPSCMRSRIVLVDISDPSWFLEGLNRGHKISAETFVPSTEALDLFDQLSSMRMCLNIAAAQRNSGGV